jgi:quinolinate synthase
MGETAKAIMGDRAKVYMPAKPGCSLVDSIDLARIKRWQETCPDGVVISYVNTDAATKAISDYICTSRNAAQVLDHAATANPGKRILFLPDKFLGSVSIAQSEFVDPSLVDLYDGFCHVHAKMTPPPRLSATTFARRGMRRRCWIMPQRQTPGNASCSCRTSS